MNENSFITLPSRYARREDATEGLTTALEVILQHVAMELESVLYKELSSVHYPASIQVMDVLLNYVFKHYLI